MSSAFERERFNFERECEERLQEYRLKQFGHIIKGLEWKKGIHDLYECAVLSDDEVKVIEPLVNLEGHELRYHDDQYTYLVGRAPLANWEISPLSLIRYKDNSTSVAVIIFVYNLRWRRIIEESEGLK